MKFMFNTLQDKTTEYRLIDISKKFKENVVLENLNLNLPKKGILVISGPSGEGKTTLLRIIAGLIAPDSGVKEGFEEKKMTYLFQEDRLLPWFDIINNVKSVLKDKDREEKAKYWLDRMRLKDAYNKFPHELSGGMKRRVALARAFAYGGDLYLFDEPYKGLDNALKSEIINVTKEECAHKMLIVVTHDNKEAELLL